MVVVPHIWLNVEPLSTAAFAPFGEVLEASGEGRMINAGTCRRFDTPAKIDAGSGGTVQVSIFRARAQSFPLPLRLLERHPLGSQAFMPLDGRPYLVVVAHDGYEAWAQRLHVFRCTGRQGVNYRPNTWHHPLIALEADSDFLVIDRRGPGKNCDEVDIENQGLGVTGQWT